MSALLAELEAWRDRYRMCVRTDPGNSDRRWRAVAGWAAAHVERDRELDALPVDDEELTEEARAWLEELK